LLGKEKSGERERGPNGRKIGSFLDICQTKARGTTRVPFRAPKNHVKLSIRKGNGMSKRMEVRNREKNRTWVRRREKKKILEEKIRWVGARENKGSAKASTTCAQLCVRC